MIRFQFKGNPGMGKKMESKRKAISYIRMSTEIQLQGNSLQRQTNLTKLYCKENDLELVNELQDIGLSGFSGKHKERGELGAFFEGIRSKEIDPNTVLVVENLDRLSRQDPLTALTQFSEILTYGIEIHTLFDKQVYTKEEVGNNMGLLFLSIGQMIRAYDESKTKSKRLSSVWDKKRDNNEILTSISPNWINPVKDDQGKVKGFELDPVESMVVRKIFDLTINENMGAYAITRYLNSHLDKYPKKKTRKNGTSDWGQSYVKKILGNPSVYGSYQPMKRVEGKRVNAGDLIESYYPPVITKEEFILAQDRMKTRAISGKGRKGKGFPNLFTGLLKCDDCGSTIVYKDRGNSRGIEDVRLQCSSSLQGKNQCHAKGWMYDHFQNVILNTIADLDFIEIFKDQGEKDKKRELELAITSHKSDLSSMNTQMDNLMDNLANTPISTPEAVRNRLFESITSLDQEISKLGDLISNLEGEYDSLTNKPSKEIHDGMVRDIKAILRGDSDKTDEEMESFRREINTSLKKIITSIRLQTDPKITDEFTIDDINPDFLKWFLMSRTDRTWYNDPLEYIKTSKGAMDYTSFIRSIRIEFKNGEKRVIMPNEQYLIHHKKPLTGLSAELNEEITGTSVD